MAQAGIIKCLQKCIEKDKATLQDQVYDKLSCSILLCIDTMRFTWGALLAQIRHVYYFKQRLITFLALCIALCLFTIVSLIIKLANEDK